MCGRFTLSVELETFINVFKINIPADKYGPRYNISPGQSIRVVLTEAGERGTKLFHWGLIPNWAKDKSFSYKMINARAETVHQKPSFRDSFRRRRCLIPADGYYEWRKENNKKQPWRIIIPDRPVFAFAALWDRWLSPQNKEIHSCCIVTTTAADAIKIIHERMPVILAEESEQNAWLSSDDTMSIKELLRPYSGKLRAYPVSPEVNSPRSDHPGLTERFKE